MHMKEAIAPVTLPFIALENETVSDGDRARIGWLGDPPPR